MKELTLHRLERNDFATYGQMLGADAKAICVTLERPFVDANGDGLTDSNVSCIPAGVYTFHYRETSGHGYPVFELDGVPGRKNIQIHIGCLPRDSKGCILLGSHFGEVDYGDGKPDGKGHGVTESHAAYDRFMALMKGTLTGTLTVIDP